MKNFKKILVNIVALLVALAYIFPALWLVLSAFKPGSELFSYPLTIFPKRFTFENFVSVWETVDVLVYMKNTFVVTIIATILTVIVCTTCGYALAKYKYKWMNILFICLLATTMLPMEVNMVPNFEVVYRLGMYNSLAGIIIPTIGSLTGVFMMRQFFVTVPDSLMEAARIDGASELKILTKIMFPLARPIIAILTIFSVKWRWNDYIWPLLVIDDPKKFTFQLALRNFIGEDSIDWSSLLAVSVISILPLVIVFVIFQKQIMNSAANSGIK